MTTQDTVETRPITCIAPEKSAEGRCGSQPAIQKAIRREFSERTKAQAWARCKGRCECCSFDLKIGFALMKARSGSRPPFTFDHRIPDWMGGKNDLANCQVLCWLCDKAKTAGDQKQIAKSKRIIKKNSGRAKSKRGFRMWRKFNGEIVYAGRP